MILWKERQLVFYKLWGAQWDQNNAASLALKEFSTWCRSGGQHPFSQQTDMQQGSEGLEVDSTAGHVALGMARQPGEWPHWPHATLRWGELKWLLCFHIPTDLSPTPQLSLPPPPALSIPHLQALLLQHWPGSCKTLLFLSKNVHLWVLSLSQVQL